jgi:5-methyltetrahydrofolate--homocysteine methyltransferase
VNDASRAVGVTSALLSGEQRDGYVANVRSEYARIADTHARGEEQKRRVKLAAARANALKLDWTGSYVPTRPQALGVTVLRDVPLAELVAFIDWSPFFSTWELTGKYPAILDDDKYGAAARALFEDAQAMLGRIVGENWFDARAVAGFWPANARGDDILVYADETREKPIAVLHTLRQQLARREGRANVALSDFIAPRTSGIADYIGAFIVTAGIGEDDIANRFKGANDDYSSIMVKALADRLAEAFAECLHKRVRDEWGYGCAENFTPEELIQEKYRGIRPAPGYPACPDHTEKGLLWSLLDVEANTGMQITESFAMWPGSSVSGLYFAHPESRYFSLGKIDRDQVDDYHKRKGMTVAEVERWLGQNLNYDPAASS